MTTKGGFQKGKHTTSDDHSPNQTLVISLPKGGGSIRGVLVQKRIKCIYS
ncbi:hypothetical protein [Bacillus cereus]|nr:hypothetical protein [Bacillus cereus]